MTQLVHHIKSRGWYSNIPCPIRQPHNMRTLQIRISPKPFLQPSIIDRIIHGTRKEMQLHRHTIQGSLQMLQSDIIPQFKLLLSILHNPLPTSINPNINISRSANTAINIFVKAVIRSKSIPFSIQVKEEDEVTANAKAAFKELRAKAERGETPELTLDEINEKIREVRRLRKERNGICSH